jgi:hypothetical protein
MVVIQHLWYGLLKVVVVVLVEVALAAMVVVVVVALVNLTILLVQQLSEIKDMEAVQGMVPTVTHPVVAVVWVPLVLRQQPQALVTEALA